MQFDQTDAGEAFLFGENARDPRARRHIGDLPENPYFCEYLIFRETLDFYGRLHDLGQAARKNQWDRLAELLDLHKIARERVRTLSKGTRQRLGFAATLVGDPELLILDEPMSGLDPHGRRHLRELILQI